MTVLVDKINDFEGRMQHPRGVRGALEFKAVQSLNRLGDDKSKFRKWHQKMVGALG